MDHIFTSENSALVSGRLKFRIILFLIIAVVMFGIMAYDVVLREAPWWMALAGLAVGLGIGFIFGRLARVRWHDTEEKVVTQNDAMGIVVIVAYIGVAALRNVVLHDILSGNALLTVTFALAAGVLFGRFYGMHISIMKVLNERKAA